MKFGIFYELQLPRPWEPDSELTLYHNALDQLELADRLGYDFAWEVEHHFLEEYSHSPAPEVFEAAPRRARRSLAPSAPTESAAPPSRSTRGAARGPASGRTAHPRRHRHSV